MKIIFQKSKFFLSGGISTLLCHSVPPRGLGSFIWKFLWIYTENAMNAWVAVSPWDFVSRWVLYSFGMFSDGWSVNLLALVVELLPDISDESLADSFLPLAPLLVISEAAVNCDWRKTTISTRPIKKLPLCSAESVGWFNPIWAGSRYGTVTNLSYKTKMFLAAPDGAPLQIFESLNQCPLPSSRLISSPRADLQLGFLWKYLFAAPRENSTSFCCVFVASTLLERCRDVGQDGRCCSPPLTRSSSSHLPTSDPPFCWRWQILLFSKIPKRKMP